MIFEPVDLSVERKFYSRTKNQHILDVFLKYGKPVMKAEFASDYKNVYSAAASLNQSAKRYKYPVSVHVFEGELYFVKEGESCD